MYLLSKQGNGYSTLPSEEVGMRKRYSLDSDPMVVMSAWTQTGMQ